MRVKYTTDEEQLDALEAKFPPEMHKTREESNKVFTYLEHTTVAERLRDVLGTGLSITTGQVLHDPSITLTDPVMGYVDMEVIIRAEFVSGRTMTVSGWGSGDVLSTRPLDNEKILEGKKRSRAGEPCKTAFSDGLKVAATRLGVGAYLYSDEGKSEIMAESKKAEEATRAKKALTCQLCEAEIVAGTLDGVVLDAAEYMNAARKKYKKRLCAACVAKAGS